MHSEDLDVHNGDLRRVLVVAQDRRRYKPNVPRLECRQSRWQYIRAATVPKKCIVSILLHKRIAVLLKRRPTSGQLNPLDNLLSLRVAINSRQDPTGWMEASEDVKDNQTPFVIPQ
jgi:hypothetical protein